MGHNGGNPRGRIADTGTASDRGGPDRRQDGHRGQGRREPSAGEPLFAGGMPRDRGMDLDCLLIGAESGCRES